MFRAVDVQGVIPAISGGGLTTSGVAGVSTSIMAGTSKGIGMAGVFPSVPSERSLITLSAKSSSAAASIRDLQVLNGFGNVMFLYLIFVGSALVRTPALYHLLARTVYAGVSGVLRMRLGAPHPCFTAPLEPLHLRLYHTPPLPHLLLLLLR